jgi:hypothetical protein
MVAQPPPLGRHQHQGMRTDKGGFGSTWLVHALAAPLPIRGLRCHQMIRAPCPETKCTAPSALCPQRHPVALRVCAQSNARAEDARQAPISKKGEKDGLSWALTIVLFSYSKSVIASVINARTRLYSLGLTLTVAWL